PENDPTALFISAGMQPLVPFLLGVPHPAGRRLVDVQRCLRTNDIEEVGDASHLTFFEMLGNWSLGDYFKAESLAWSYEFLTQVLGLPPERLQVTVFAGDDRTPRDDESADHWRRLGLPSDRIHYLPKSDNWWGPVGASGPCGPDSEIFFDTGRPDHPGCRPGCSCGKWFEVWNNVFMEYNQAADGSLVKLRQHNVDTGMGVERTAAVLGGHDDVYRVDTLQPLIERLEALSGRGYGEQPLAFRVIADHVRAASCAIADGALPSNVEAGYVVRRMIRRAVRYGRDLGLRDNFCAGIVGAMLDTLAAEYPVLERNRTLIAEALDREETRFKATLERGLKEYEKAARNVSGGTLSGEAAFNLFETFGFPLPLTIELAQEGGLRVDQGRFEALYAEHQAQSRRGMDRKFRGGLAEQTEETSRLHTATHLLHAALRQVLGSEVQQKGSNITAERLRFDFSFPRRLTPEEVRQVETIVNEQIRRDLPVSTAVMTLADALAAGALAFFGDKYGAQVKVYSVGDFSKEVCGGPHAARSGELGQFRITKEEAVGQGVRRIRAVLEAPNGAS
ncbi:MAG: alanine--tRNA ligase, partial [Anaerolineales bacterium]